VHCFKTTSVHFRRLPKASGLNFAEVTQTMPTVESLLPLIICVGAAASIGWLFGQAKKGVRNRFSSIGAGNLPSRGTLPSRKPERLPSTDQTSLSLVVAPPRPHRSPVSPFASQSDCIDAIVSSPIPDDSYMITSECIIFAGTKEECADFLEDRGIIPFEDTIEPFDIRLQSKMNELGVRVFRRNLC
jgi:hypothetical protein